MYIKNSEETLDWEYGRKEKNYSEYEDDNLGMKKRRNMMMENIRMETWEYGREGT
jgi:hypothetical protein